MHVAEGYYPSYMHVLLYTALYEHEYVERWTYAADFMHVDDDRGARARHALLGGICCWYSGVPNSNTVPVPHNRTIRAAPSNAQNMIVIRLFSFTCDIVSTPSAGDQM